MTIEHKMTPRFDHPATLQSASSEALVSTGSAHYCRIMFRKHGTHAGAPKSSRLPRNDLRPPMRASRKLNLVFPERQTILCAGGIFRRTIFPIPFGAHSVTPVQQVSGRK